MVDLIKFPFGQMPITQTGATQAPAQTQFTPTVDYEQPNMFSGHLVGLNSNIGIGDHQDGQMQAGRKLGGRTIAFG